jgi:site-specific DNA recombinase
MPVFRDYSQTNRTRRERTRAIAKQTGLDERYIRRILRFAFLAPDIVESILDGRQPHDLTLEKLRAKLPMSWAEQRIAILRSESVDRTN